jgi:Spy/CpxP family protein refolding chaperone
MKSTVKIVLSLLAFGVAAFAPSLNAAEKKGKGGGMNADAMVDRIDQAVTLTADQKAKIKDIYAKNMEKMREAQGQDRRAIMEAQRAEVRAVLTPEQQKKFDDMPQGQRGGKGGGKGKRNDQ